MAAGSSSSSFIFDGLAVNTGIGFGLSLAFVFMSWGLYWSLLYYYQYIPEFIMKKPNGAEQNNTNDSNKKTTCGCHRCLVLAIFVSWSCSSAIYRMRFRWLYSREGGIQRDGIFLFIVSVLFGCCWMASAVLPEQSTTTTAAAAATTTTEDLPPTTEDSISSRRHDVIDTNQQAQQEQEEIPIPSSSSANRQRQGLLPFSTVGRRFLFVMCSALSAGFVLTAVSFRRHQDLEDYKYLGPMRVLEHSVVKPYLSHPIYRGQVSVGWACSSSTKKWWWCESTFFAPNCHCGDASNSTRARIQAKRCVEDFINYPLWQQNNNATSGYPDGEYDPMVPLDNITDWPLVDGAGDCSSSSSSCRAKSGKVVRQKLQFVNRVALAGMAMVSAGLLMMLFLLSFSSLRMACPVPLLP